MRGALSLAAAALILTVSGCVQLIADTSLDRRGGGVCAISYSLSDQVLQDVREMSRRSAALGMPALDLPDPDALDEPALRRACAANGVEIRRLRRGGDGRSGLDLVLAFPGVDNLAAVLEQALGSAALCPALTRTLDGDYVLSARPRPRPSGADPGPLPAADSADLSGIDPDSLRRAEEISARLILAADDLLVRFSLKVPGRILDHNAHRIENGCCVWEMRADNLLQADDLSPTVVFSGAGLDLRARAPE